MGKEEREHVHIWTLTELYTQNLMKAHRSADQITRNRVANDIFQQSPSRPKLFPPPETTC